MLANRKFKNSVFVTLFDNPDLLRELYCAIEGVTLPPNVPVSINTLENVLFMDFNNDISFEIDGKLVILIEHQSTLSPNMALRLLIYITRVLEKKVEGGTLYSKKRLSIPWPEFFVLYNGTDPFPDNAVLKLSDLFEKSESLGLSGKTSPLLELEVKIININEGKNEAIANRCKKLSEYSLFMGKIREYNKELGNLETAIRKAVKYCQKHAILNEFLEIHASEVLNMILTEWNTEDAIAYARKEGREEGWEEGLEEGMEKGRVESYRIIAKNALLKGFSPEVIKDITGFDVEAIQDFHT